MNEGGRDEGGGRYRWAGMPAPDVPDVLVVRIGVLAFALDDRGPRIRVLAADTVREM